MKFKRKKIIRIETSLNGYGLYTSNQRSFHSILSSERLEARFLDLHVMPHYDYKLREYYNSCFSYEFDRFGFCNNKQLKRWIFRPHWRQKLTNLGFVVREFYASSLSGDTQCIYKDNTREDTLEEYRLIDC